MYYVISYADGRVYSLDDVDYDYALYYAATYSCGEDFTIEEYASEIDYLNSLVK